MSRSGSNHLWIESRLNSTTTPLSSWATYTWSWELNSQPMVWVMCKTDNNWTLYFDFSNDGTNWDSTFPVNWFNVVANIPEFHTAVKLWRYFRVRLVNDTWAQTFLRLKTYYWSWFLPSNAPLNQSIWSDSDATLTRSVLTGQTASWKFINIWATDQRAIITTPPVSWRTAFGEMMVANLTHELLASFPYNINPLQVTTQPNQSGTVTQANSLAVLSTWAAANSSATMFTNQRIRYQPWHGSRARFTALFTTWAANSTQIAGIWDTANWFFFWYNWTSFGILHRKNGSIEVRTLTVTTASTTAENITITLDWDAKSDVAVTNSWVITTTVNEIASADYSDVWRWWTASAVWNTVVFVSWYAGVQDGTYSLSGATTAVWTFAQSVIWAAPTETWTAQASWNWVDIFDWNGDTGVTIDPTKGNVYQISYQWLWFWSIAFFIEDPDDWEFHLVHTIEYANSETTPSLSNPTLPIFMSAENTSNTTDIVVKTASLWGFTDWQSELIWPRFWVSASITLWATSAETPILTIRNSEVFQSKDNQTQIKILIVWASVEHSKPVEIVFYANPVLTWASFVHFNTNTSALQYDTSATAFSNWTQLFAIALWKTGNTTIDLSSDRYAGILTPWNSITATIKPKSGNAAEATISYNVVELY